MRLRDKQTGEVGDYFLTNQKREKIAIVPNGKSPSEGFVFNSLKEMFERFEDAPKEKTYGGRVPILDDIYWFISDASICENVWREYPADRDHFESGNGFWSKEEAEKELKRRKAYVILKEDTKGFEPDWERNGQKWYPYYNFEEEDFAPSYDRGYARECLYFATREDVMDSIENHRQAWLDYLGIEEEG